MPLESMIKIAIRTADNDTKYHSEPSLKSLKQNFQLWLHPYNNLKAKAEDVVYWGSVLCFRLTKNLYSQPTK